MKTESRTDKARRQFDTFWSQLDYSQELIKGLPGGTMEIIQKRKQQFETDVMLAGPLLGPPPKIFKNNAYIFLNGAVVHKYSKQADYFETLGAPGVHFHPGR